MRSAVRIRPSRPRPAQTLIPIRISPPGTHPSRLTPLLTPYGTAVMSHSDSLPAHRRGRRPSVYGSGRPHGPGHSWPLPHFCVWLPLPPNASSPIRSPKSPLPSRATPHRHHCVSQDHTCPPHPLSPFLMTAPDRPRRLASPPHTRTRHPPPSTTTHRPPSNGASHPPSPPKRRSQSASLPPTPLLPPLTPPSEPLHSQFISPIPPGSPTSTIPPAPLLCHSDPAAPRKRPATCEPRH